MSVEQGGRLKVPSHADILRDHSNACLELHFPESLQPLQRGHLGLGRGSDVSESLMQEEGAVLYVIWCLGSPAYTLLFQFAARKMFLSLLEA